MMTGCMPCRPYYTALNGVPDANIHGAPISYRYYFKMKFRMMVDSGMKCEEIRDSIKNEMLRVDLYDLNEKHFVLKFVK